MDDGTNADEGREVNDSIFVERRARHFYGNGGDIVRVSSGLTSGRRFAQSSWHGAPLRNNENIPPNIEIIRRKPKEPEKPKEEEELKPTTLKDFTNKSKEDLRNREAFREAMIMWRMSIRRNVFAFFSDIFLLFFCRTGLLSAIRKYVVLLVYNDSEYLFYARRERDKERTILDVLIPYPLPLLSYSRSKRLLNHDFYIPDLFIISKLLHNQFKSRKLIYKKATLVFYFLIPSYFVLRNVTPLQCAEKTLSILPCVFSTSIVGYVFNFVFLCIVEALLNVHKLLLIARTPVTDHTTEYAFLFVSMFYHVYIESLDILKLEYEFMKRHIHLVFSPTSFLFYCYSYLFLSLIIPYFFVFLLFRCYYLLIPFVTIIILVVNLSHYLGNLVNYVIFSGLLLISVKYFMEFDAFFNVPFFVRTEGINIVLLSYRISMSCYEERFRLASLVRLMTLLFFLYIGVLGLDSLRNLFDQSVTNCEAFKEGYELRHEDIRQNVEREIRLLDEYISLFRESQDDPHFLRTMHETIRLLRRRYESTRA
ncbi:UNVERIFIED_CONTAM: hypothetical protein PYX00_011703 [Menopon gallinae]|uniref:Uncharacterized protein n=1 Tax=Menopon gallinae TaxID=328185 RepID=A0AAW2H8H1_9NEOP